MFDGTEDIKGHIDTALPDLARKFETQLSKTEDALTLRFNSIQTSLENFIKKSLEKPLRPVSQHEFLIVPHEMTGNSTAAGHTLNPSSSHATCPAPQQNSTLSTEAETRQLISLTPITGSCDCLRNSRGPQARGMPHLHAHLKRNRKTFAGGLRVFRYLVQVRVAIEYSHQAFLNEIQIQPNLTIRATVPSDSPAFTLVHDIVRNLLLPEEEFRQKVRVCLRDLQDLFSRDQARPTDIDIQGDNLMDVRLSSLSPCIDVFNSKFTTARLQNSRAAFAATHRANIFRLSRWTGTFARSAWLARHAHPLVHVYRN